MAITPLLKLAACLALVIAILGGWHELKTHYRQQGYALAKAEDRAAADEQAQRNRELQRKAETKYVVQAATRERFIVTTVKELSDAAAPLADCRVPDAVRVRLNAIRDCSLGDSTSCGSPDGAMPKP